MSVNQFLAIIFFIQLWNAEGWISFVGFLGFVGFGFFAMLDGFKYARLHSDE